MKRHFIEKVLLTAIVVVSAAAAVFGQTAGGTPATDEQASQVTEFEVNGLKVLVKKRESAPTVAAGLFIRGGVRNVTARNAGIENLMIAAATEAGKKFPRDAVRRILSGTGSSVGGSAGTDFSVISLASTRKDFDRVWEIFTDVAIDPAFVPADVERVRSQILTGLREQETDPDNFLTVLQERVVYAGHPYSNDTGGTIDSITQLTIPELRAHHRKVMQTSQLLLVFVGDLDAEDLRKRIEASFGKLPRGNYKPAPLPALDFSKPTLDVVSRSLPTNYIQGVFNAPALTDPDYYAMRVATVVLRSRLFQEVRVKRQLSYAPNADLGSDEVNTGTIYVTAVDANQSVSVMLAEIEKLKRQLVDDDEIEGVAGLFLTTYFLRQETNAAQAGDLARYELLGGGWRGSFDFLEKIRQVKDVDIQRVAKKYMNNVRFVVIGNPAAVNRDVFLGK